MEVCSWHPRAIFESGDDLGRACDQAVDLGVVDWDYLHPAPRLDDVAYALRWFAPLRSDEHAANWHHFPAVPDRRARARAFVAACGGLPEFDVVDVVTERIRSVISLRRELAEPGIEPQRTRVADGAEDRDLEEIAWIEDHREALSLLGP